MTTTADIDKNLRRADLSVPERAEHRELRAKILGKNQGTVEF